MKLKYMLDTNICIYLAKNKSKAISIKLKKLNLGQVGISVITFGELCYGVEKSQHVERSLENLNSIVSLILPIQMSSNVASYYGKIRADLSSKGKTIGANDLWIAAHALDLGVTLVTNNTKELKRVDGLSLENWAVPVRSY